jgi:hypothetical protein
MIAAPETRQKAVIGVGERGARRRQARNSTAKRASLRSHYRWKRPMNSDLKVN